MKVLYLLFSTDEDLKMYEQIKNKTSAIFGHDKLNTFIRCKGSGKQYKIKYLKFSFNEITLNALSDKFLQIILYSHSQVEKFGKLIHPDENFEFFPEFYEYGKKDPKQILLSYIKQGLYFLDSTKSLNMLNICTGIPFKLLTKRHIGGNGNKRTALVTCINLLKYFGFYLSYSKQSGLSTKSKDRGYKLFTQYVRDDKHPERCVELNPKAFYDIYKLFHEEIINGVYFNAYSIKEVKDE